MLEAPQNGSTWVKIWKKKNTLFQSLIAKTITQRAAF